MHMDELNDTTIEVEKCKSSINLNVPVSVGFFVLQYGKLKILRFYYDFLMKYVDFSDFCLVQMDTDSLYLGISGKNLFRCVRTESRSAFINEYEQWMTKDYCDEHKAEFFETVFAGKDWNGDRCCIEAAKYSSRTPGLFHVEFRGDYIVALSSKCYYCGPNPKISSKGISKRHNKLTEDDYYNILANKTTATGLNKGFRLKGSDMYTYTQNRRGLSYLYTKRVVANNGVSTLPTQL